MNISSETFALIGNGNYNFITDKLDLNMRVNANALFGILALSHQQNLRVPRRRHDEGPQVGRPKNF